MPCCGFGVIPWSWRRNRRDFSCVQYVTLVSFRLLSSSFLGIRRKRALPELEEDVFGRLKRAKVVTNVPSITSRINNYQRLQEDPSQKILDDQPDSDIPPVPLLYKGFGHFLDIMDGRIDVPGLCDVDVHRLRKRVDDLASEMTEYFDNEDAWRDAGLPLIDRIFSARRGTAIPGLCGSAKSDDHNVASHGAGTLVVELKNWITDITCLPQVELTCYFARLIASRMGDTARRQIFLGWGVPCLCLTIVGKFKFSLSIDVLIFLGCDITFYAIVAIDQRAL